MRAIINYQQKYNRFSLQINVVVGTDRNTRSYAGTLFHVLVPESYDNTKLLINFLNNYGNISRWCE